MSSWRANTVTLMLAHAQAEARARGHVMTAWERLEPEPVDSKRRPSIWHNRCMKCNLRSEINEGAPHLESPTVYGTALAVNCIGKEK